MAPLALTNGVRAYSEFRTAMCAVTSNGSVLWAGYLHRGPVVDVTEYLAKVDPSVPVRIVCDEEILCVRDSIWHCAGRFFFGDAGAGRAPGPIDFDGLANADEVIPYLDGVCTLTRGDLSCWGDLGVGFATGQTPRRVEIPDVVKLEAGGIPFAVIMNARHEVYCWGRNADGVCGPRDIGGIVALPRLVATGIQDISAGIAAAWLLRTDGVLLGVGHVDFPSPLRKLRRGSPEGPTSSDEYFYSDVPIPVPLPGTVKRLLDARQPGCLELQSGDTGCVDLAGWHSRPAAEIAPCIVSDGGVVCNGAPRKLPWE